MPQPNKIPLAFAASGDKNVIPESTETTGFASWREGFPAITSAPFSEGGIAPKRADFNGIFYALSQAVMWLQQGGMYAYDVNTDYEAGNVVLDAGGLYVANAANGPSSVVVQPSSDTTGATWKPVRLDLATHSAAGYMSAADKAKCDAALTGTTTYSPSYSGGSYYLTKHSNGLMLLAGNAKIATNSAYGGVNYYFPEAFMQNPAFTITSKNYFNFYVPSRSTASFGLGFRNLDGSYPDVGTEIEFNFIVVGRWS